MHRIFGIPEIVTIIAEEGFSDDDHTVRKGVLSLAGTCHIVYEPVANVIWHDITTLTPLIECIPQEIRTHALGNSNTNSVVRSALPEDLSRLRLNANRVRVYGIDVDPRDIQDDKDLDLPEEATAATFSILSLLCGGHTLLSNLREANLNHLNADVLPFVHLITPPELRTLSIAVVFDNMSQKEIFSHLSFLNSLGVRFPRLQNLHIKTKNDRVTGMTPLALAGVLQSARWQNLSSLQIDGKPVPYSVILPLLHSKTIRDIRLWFNESEEIPQEFNLAKNNTSSIFPSIERLSLEFYELSQGIKFLNFLAPNDSPIRAISLTAHKGLRSSSNIWQRLCETIGTTFTMAEDLEEIMLDDVVNSESVFFLSIREIGPLCSFSGLQKIFIISRGIIDLDGDDMRHLAMAWPEARQLTLIGSSTPSKPPKVTIEVLGVFAEFCPNLRHLALEFNALVPQISLPGPQLPPRGYELKVLVVYTSPIDSPEVVAAFISDVFPNIGRVTSLWETDEAADSRHINERVKAWNQVDKLVTIFAQARYDEAQRILAF